MSQLATIPSPDDHQQTPHRPSAVLLVGPGAVGLSLATMLKARMPNIYLAVKGTPRHVGILDTGMYLTGKFGTAEAKPDCVVSNFADLQRHRKAGFDLIIVAGKANAIPTLCRGMEEVLARSDRVLATMNGMGRHRELVKALGSKVGIATSSVMFGAQPFSQSTPSAVQVTASGSLRMGSEDGSFPLVELKQWAEVFSQVGIPSQAVGPAHRVAEEWKKGLFNSIVNPICALLERRRMAVSACLGDLLHLPDDLYQLALGAAGEILALGRAWGVPLEWAEAQDWWTAHTPIIAQKAEHRPSMSWDIFEHCRRSEIEVLNAWFVNRGREFGLNMAQNDRLVHAIRDIEVEYGCT